MVILGFSRFFKLDIQQGDFIIEEMKTTMASLVLLSCAIVIASARPGRQMYSRATAALNASSCGSVWPKPHHCKLGNDTLMVEPSFVAKLHPESQCVSHPALIAAMKRCSEHSVGVKYTIIHRTRGLNDQEPISADDDDNTLNNEKSIRSVAGVLTELLVMVVGNESESGTYKSPGSDESYSLVVDVRTATVTAVTVWGAIYGNVQYVFQLIFGNVHQLIFGNNISRS